MSIKILYIEDDEYDRDSISKAIISSNEYRSTQLCKKLNTEQNLKERSLVAYPHFELKCIKHPHYIEKIANWGFDIILADVYFNDDKLPEHLPKGYMLDVIIKQVADKDREAGITRNTPIIAYTDATQKELERVFEYRDYLLDIWSKGTVPAHFAILRFEQLALELARLKPGALLQRIIRQMDSDVSWHPHVLEMIQAYDSGITENEQIQEVKEPIKLIATSISTDYAEIGAFTSKWWDTICRWESFSRSASPTVRGHARHVINVFWMGYYILNQKELKPFFDLAYSNLEKKRAGMHLVAGTSSTSFFLNAWFFASLFHDTGGVIEKFNSVPEALTKITKEIECNVKGALSLNWKSPHTEKAIRQLFSNDSADDWIEELETVFIESEKKIMPDHGIAAGIKLIEALSDSNEKLQIYAKEAARAMSAHNLISNKIFQRKKISWDTDFITCLLILCDQIQTWDREREDKTHESWKKPASAELVNFKLDKNDTGELTMKIDVNYLSMRFLDNTPALFDKMKNDLSGIIATFPKSALARLEDWPFKLSVNFYLNGQPLSVQIDFG